ncbi:hypothetical protein [Listeria phage List-36]|uniref:3D domain-containing protein n=4 Tax=Pecentumvirus TaxID=1857844 RepID=A0A060AFW1_9CAUD|nr:hypothetical protein HH39_gp170 [Listeria phage LMSP-25]YP_009043472.1 hypothetical protein HH35_gp096 [Listeria phage List-36]YP_009616206.1 hypothetical protein FDI77_gp170 [Listeria phage LMTA-34]YP_009793441.1 3D domain containing protein [Listeria phage LMTA-57]AIA64265.1 hypothetical protein [Listeria phage List-36]AIA64446.1 hypothetical protein [Listeria phage LMSP-25]AID17004.1 hypothetical protein [Listeria phage LMTA-34]AID17592.1 3D domain containing protein [Listeria phage LM
MKKGSKIAIATVVAVLIIVTVSLGYHTVKLNETNEAKTEEVAKLKENISSVSKDLDNLGKEHEKKVSESEVLKKDLDNKKKELEDKNKKEEQLKKEKEELQKQVSYKKSLKKKAVAENIPNAVKNNKSTKSDGDVKTEETKGSSFSVEVTYYAVGDGFTPGVHTANGTNVQNTITTSEGHRIIAVDPSVIPMNSIVKVTTGNGESFVAKACDTGGAIKGNIIDILVEPSADIYQLGRTTGTVEIIG